MRIILYSVRNEELNSITKWGKDHQVEIFTTNQNLNEESVNLAKDFDGICIQQTSELNSEEIFSKLKEFGIKQITTRTTGYDNIDIKLASKYGLLVSNVPSYSPNAIAELALTHTMNLVRRMYIISENVKQRDFRWENLIAPEIRSLVVGVIGVGKIGSTYAKLVHGLGAKVIGFDLVVNPILDFVEYQEDLKSLLEKSDVISIHTPLDESTHNLINEHTLSYLKPSAYIVNTARGGIVNTNDLIRFLESNKIAGVALDTLDCEVGIFNYNFKNKQIESENMQKLLNMSNVYITPHIGFNTYTAIKNMVDISLDSIKDILEKGTSINIVNGGNL